MGNLTFYCVRKLKKSATYLSVLDLLAVTSTQSLFASYGLNTAPPVLHKNTRVSVAHGRHIKD